MRVARTGVAKGEVKVGSKFPSELSLATRGLDDPRKVLKLPPARIFPSGCTATARINPSAPAPLMKSLSRVPATCTAKAAWKPQLRNKSRGPMPEGRRPEKRPNAEE